MAIVFFSPHFAIKLNRILIVEFPAAWKPTGPLLLSVAAKGGRENWEK